MLVLNLAALWLLLCGPILVECNRDADSRSRHSRDRSQERGRFRGTMDKTAIGAVPLYASYTEWQFCR